MPLDRALRQLREREAELARVQRIGQIGGLEVDLRGGAFLNKRSPEYLRVHGLPPEAANESHESWVARIHPDDRSRVVEHFLRTVQGTDLDYEVEYRIVRPSDGETRWIRAKAEIERDENQTAIRLVGAHLDITARRQAEEKATLVSRELTHRIANIFTVVTSLIQMSARSEPEASDFAAKVTSRITSLHRAHSFVVPATEADGSMLIALLDRLVAPYREAGAERISIVGDDLAIGEGATTAFALILHELATNAVKYGAWSRPEGQVAITIRREEETASLTWAETGGPPIDLAPSRRGFGSVLVDRAARSQLGAVLDFDWAPAGLIVRIQIPIERLGA